MKSIKAENVDEYIAGFPKETQKLLQQLRSTIVKAAPDADEVISYAMPGYKYFGMLVFFAGYKNHVGFYPGTSSVKTFKKELSAFKSAKGSVQFPLDEPLQLQLITKIVRFRVKENKERAAVKAKTAGRKQPA